MYLFLFEPIFLNKARLPLWGRVVTTEVAQRLPKATLFDMGDSSGDGPRLFLDGSLHTNTRASHCCLGWLVPPLASAPGGKKKGVKEARENVEDDDVDNDCPPTFVFQNEIRIT